MTTWKADIPSDPGTHVTTVWDKNGAEWNRQTRSTYFVSSRGYTSEWENLVFRYGPLSDTPPLPAIPDDAEYAISEDSVDVYKKDGTQWIDFNSRDYITVELPTDEPLIFLKRVT